MEKLYDRIDWSNDTTPAINETNLNAMSKAIDDIDDRVIEVAGEAVEASTYATAAEDSASEAATYATNAYNYQTSASSSATTANSNMLTSEGYALGTQNGVAVSSDSHYYHNNSKYYCEQAFSATPEGYEELVEQVSTNTTDIATNAENIATNTTNIATNADNISTNTQNIATLNSNLTELSTIEDITSTFMGSSSVGSVVTSQTSVHKIGNNHIIGDVTFAFDSAMGTDTVNLARLTYIPINAFACICFASTGQYGTTAWTPIHMNILSTNGTIQVRDYLDGTETYLRFHLDYITS